MVRSCQVKTDFLYSVFYGEIFPNDDDDATISYVPDGVYDKIFFKAWEMRLKDGMMNVNEYL